MKTHPTREQQAAARAAFAAVTVEQPFDERVRAAFTAAGLPVRPVKYYPCNFPWLAGEGTAARKKGPRKAPTSRRAPKPRRAAPAVPQPETAPPPAPAAPVIVVEVNGDRMSLQNLATLATALRDTSRAIFGPGPAPARPVLEIAGEVPAPVPRRLGNGSAPVPPARAAARALAAEEDPDDTTLLAIKTLTEKLNAARREGTTPAKIERLERGLEELWEKRRADQAVEEIS